MTDHLEPDDEEDEVDEALYTLHFLSGSRPPDALPGLKQVSSKSCDDKVFTSEWLIVEPLFDEIVRELPSFNVLMKQFRMYKPIKDQWCVVEWRWIQMAIDHEFTLAI